MRPHHLVLPLAAAIAVTPLLLHGPSCGHDFDFHLLSWLEAARQIAHGNLHPHWAFTPAFNAGEPRFVFYPPLSWTLGALLTLLLAHLPHLSPAHAFTLAPIAYTWIALTAAGLAMHALARRYTSPTPALLSATLYLANPYTLFTAYERTAFGELLAAAILPLLLLAILPRNASPTSPQPNPDTQPSPSLPLLAAAIALLWLTNAPAAVMGCYTVALVLALRALNLLRHHQSPLQLITQTAAATALGLALAAFYIVPAAYQRRFVEIDMATIPGMRIADNTLFHHTPDPAHDAVLHTASSLALLLSTLTAIALLTAYLKRAPNSVIQTEAQRSGATRFCTQEANPATTPTHLPTLLAILTATILFLLTPAAAPIWRHTPQLAFLQFPWRLLAVLAPIFALATALAMARLALRPALTTLAALTLATILTNAAYPHFQQACDPPDTPPAQLSTFLTHTGVEPTDEYTPQPADNDLLTQNTPAYALNPIGTSSKQAPGPAPTHLDLNLPQPAQLVLNLRAYPLWQITRNGAPLEPTDRDDGLLALDLPAGPSHLAITERTSRDEIAGDTLSVAALALFLPLAWRARKAAPNPR